MSEKNKTLSFFLLICSILILPACNSDKEETKETSMIVTVMSQPVTTGSGTSSMKIFMEVYVDATGEKMLIPMGDILGFNFERGFIYKLEIVKYVVAHDGIETGEVYYKLIRVISKKADEPDIPDQPTPNPNPTPNK